MIRSVLLFSLGVASIHAFQGQSCNIVTQRHTKTQQQTTTQIFGGSSGFATTLEGKKEKVEKVKNLLDSSQMIFTIPADSLTVAESQTLRRFMPEGTTISVVKNTLMKRAVDGTEYEPAASLLKGSNMWFFVEEEIGASIKAFNAFAKDSGKKESHSILGGVMEGMEYDSKGIAAIGNLPSKQELYAKIAGSIKAVPTKVARVIKAPNSKVARAIRLATADEDSE